MDQVTAEGRTEDPTLREGDVGASTEHAYAGSRFSEVWRTISADPYDALPDRRVRPVRGALSLLERRLYREARRTLVRTEDVLPEFDKLVHPTGICLRGQWRITVATPYTGLFRSGSEGLIIARVSDALGEQRPGRLRLLGLAGKLYATRDPEHGLPLPTANFFTLENLGGSHTRHVAHATLSTDLIGARPHPGMASTTLIGAVAVPAFALADRALTPTQPMIRQLYPIAELGEPPHARCFSPAVMRLVGASGNRCVDTPDVREELQMHHHPDGIRFAVQVSDQRRSSLTGRGFRTIGELHFDDSVASYSGDHRLHFAHPPYRHGLRAGRWRPW